MGSYFLPLILSWTRRCLGKSLHLLTEPMLPSYGYRPFWPLILLYYFIVSATVLPLFLFLIILWVCGLMFLPYQPTSSSILCSGLPWPNFHIFTSFRLIGQCSCHASPFYHFIPWACFAIYFFFTSFYSHVLVAKFLGLPRPFYYIFTSYYPFGLIGF